MDDSIDIVEYDHSRQFGTHLESRLAEFVDLFSKATDLPRPEFIIEAPGRINLIGDHIDYHGFSVLPMAISRSILLGVSRRPTSTSLPSGSSSTNTPQLTNGQNGQTIEWEPGQEEESGMGSLIMINNDAEKYPTFECNHSFAHGAQLDRSHQWQNYLLCGYHGILAKHFLKVEPSEVHKYSKSIADTGGDVTKLDEMRLSTLPDMVFFVDSDLPEASGLSSSSALVCASALATRLLCLNNGLDADMANAIDRISRRQLAQDCSKFEHLVGTAGGGMDQAVILTAQDGYAKHIEFMPNFQCNNVRLPKDVVWIVSHCGSQCAKAATLGFNSRVLETKLAAALIVKTLSSLGRFRHPALITEIQMNSSITLGQVVRDFFGPEMPLEEVLVEIEKLVFPQNDTAEMPIDKLCAKLGMTRPELASAFATNEKFIKMSGLDERVCLLKRCRHVLEEAQRVEQFRAICEAQASSIDVVRLGHLMTESHKSLRDNYECSHPSLDRLVEESLRADALGARLTGAGWGGCVVTLVRASQATEVQRRLEQVSNYTFPTEPQSGAKIIRGISGKCQ